ncbi:hypothetical protein A1O3_09352 [Capronia epimyces CBS 606.96]|uniref:Choline transporter n=1 Tax=Capronia epimyces CBS 606.96 TaxID=1182542 RepID=W9XMI7_9EURO|nr:uncharacterized protein A1O3_09352 [Capronia epimyces CBS 606.96]EXJ78191.1 hypothetical protein A1O3_09352 [Capronia epimyces CBS 606.96]
MSLESKTADMAIKPHAASDKPHSIAEGGLDDMANVDDAVLKANGHEAAMPRQFNWISALGLGFSITNSWVGYLSNFGQNLIYGGPQSVIFGLLVAFIVQWIITTGLSELGSAFPSSGGQYHFCYILAPPKTKRFAAYVIGWMSILAWWIVTCSGLSLAAVSLAGLVNFWHPAFVANQWQIYLMYLAVSFITVIPLFAAPRKISWTVQFTLYLSLTGFLVFFIVVLAMHKQAQPGSYITQSGLGTSGWGSGTAWMLGVTNAMYAFGATDGAIHISEEITHPGRRVPQVMGMTMAIGFMTAFPLLLALCFFIKDLDAVVSSPLPSMEIVYQAIGNKNVTTFLIVWLWLVYISALPSQWVTAGRLAWAFARDNGVPFSGYFSKIDSRLDFPVRTTCAAFLFSAIYGLLYLASTTAFNSIVTSAVLYLNITYAVPQGILLFQGRSKSLPARYLNLGYFGYLCNIFAVLWIVVLGTLICFPPTLPVTVGAMNYTSVILVGLFAIIIALWFVNGRKNFHGPTIDWELLNQANLVSEKAESKAKA